MALIAEIYCILKLWNLTYASDLDFSIFCWFLLAKWSEMRLNHIYLFLTCFVNVSWMNRFERSLSFESNGCLRTFKVFSYLRTSLSFFPFTRTFSLAICCSLKFRLSQFDQREKKVSEPSRLNERLSLGLIPDQFATQDTESNDFRGFWLPF